MNIIEKIETNLLFNAPDFKNKFFRIQDFSKNNIDIIPASVKDIRHKTGADFKQCDYYIKEVRHLRKMMNGYFMYYISPTDSNNKLEFTFPVNINVSYKLIFFCSCWNYNNIENFNIVNGDEIISLNSQINDFYCNYIKCTIKSNVENINLNISFKNKQKENYPNGLYLLNKFFIHSPEDKLYKNVITKKNNELNLYLNENKKTYDFVICMAIWKRHNVLRKVINLINSYNLPFSIGFVLIYSRSTDFNLFPNINNVHFFYASNMPLGSKWLSGIYSTQLFDPKMIMILGSDDMVSEEYIKEAYKCITKDNVEFCYGNSWLTYNANNGNLYQQSYQAKSRKILGAGRVFSRKLLKKVNYKIYDPILKCGLDNTFRLLSQIKRFKSHIIQTPGVLLYKGSWECISDLRTLLTYLPTMLLNHKSKEIKKLYHKYRLIFPTQLSPDDDFPGGTSLNTFA